jgi:hypothetical protein
MPDFPVSLPHPSPIHSSLPILQPPKATHNILNMAHDLQFDPHGPKCYKLETFFRLCGHVQKSYKHTSLCKDAIRSGLEPGHASLKFCWNPYPLGKHLAYCVGKCRACQMREEPGVDRKDEPWRHVQHGEQITVTRDVYTKDQVRDLARKWRFDVEEQERVPRTERLRMERVAEERRRQRGVQWNRAWEYHQRVTDANYTATKRLALTEKQSEIDEVIKDFNEHRRAKILDLTDDFLRPGTPDNLLERVPAADFGPERECCCLYKLSELGLDDAEDISVRFQGGCEHNFHYKCIMKHLTTQSPLCPFCREIYRFVLKNGVDDPKFRWIVDDPRNTAGSQAVASNKLWKISGHIPFHEGLNGVNAGEYTFKLFGKEDRWGDLEGRETTNS